MEFNFYKFSSRVMQDLDTAYDTNATTTAPKGVLVGSISGYNECAEFPRPFSLGTPVRCGLPGPPLPSLCAIGCARLRRTWCVARRLTLVSDSRPCASAVHEPLARAPRIPGWRPTLGTHQFDVGTRNLWWTDLLPLEELFSAPGRTVYMWGVFWLTKLHLRRGGSVMHYGMYSFSKDRRSPTILPKRENTVLLGQRRGFSQTDIVKVNRLYECGSGVAPTSPTVPVGAKPVVCSDNHRYCRHWYNTGECKTNPTWMAINCARSCTQCAVKCEDHNQHCERWATIGECAKNPDYMNIYCARACGACSDGGSTSCEDRSQHCKYWAKSGQCQENPRYMLQHCRRACRMC
uniref:Tyrosinase-like protein tyr-3 n=1 Tax=Timema poppense TaxID=170557 RepID=A0A7R9HCU7_TIMPO|nr:unnamed protein product [Timema poppensis]